MRKLQPDRSLPPLRELDVLILGPIPPPLGGIAAHVVRLVPRLQRAGLTVGVLNHFGSTEPSWVLGALNRNPLNYYRLPKRFPARVVHYHHSHWTMLLAVALGKRGSSSRYVVTSHGNNIARCLDSRNPFVRHATRWAIRRFDAVIVVNPDIKAAIEDRVGAEIEVVPAFLEAPGDELPYEPSIEAFLALGRTLLVPAFRVQLLQSRRDLYGLDLAVDAFSVVAGERPHLRLALFIAERPTGRRPARYLRMLVRRLEEAGLKDRASILFGLPLTPAFRHDVVLVRPTRIEGDAVSVREALHAGVPVVASDVVERPSGTATFATGDVAGLRCTLEQVLDGTGAASRGARRREDHEATGSDVLASLLRIYRVELDSATGDADA